MALSNNRTHRMITFCALYFAQGIPWGFMLLTLPSYLLDKHGDHFGDDGYDRRAHPFNSVGYVGQ